MIHLFPADGGHHQFKGSRDFVDSSDIDKDVPDVLWVGVNSVGWRQDTLTFIMIPWSMIKALHWLRSDAKQEWSGAG